MKRLGHDLTYVVAERQVFQDEESIYHSFLATHDGTVILDPLVTAQFYDRKRPYGILSAETSLFETTGPIEARPAGQPEAYPCSYSVTNIPALLSADSVAA